MRERTPERVDRLEQVVARRQSDLTVVFENIEDHHNVNAILRTCDAVGVYEAQLLYTWVRSPDFIRKGKRSSTGAKKWVFRCEYNSVNACYDSLRQRGFRVLASSLERDSRDIFDVDLTEPVALVFGNEREGILGEALDKADGTFHVPMEGMVQSLNVSVAAAVCLYEAMRQRRAAGLYEKPRLPSETRVQTLEKWRWM